MKKINFQMDHIPFQLVGKNYKFSILLRTYAEALCHGFEPWHFAALPSMPLCRILQVFIFNFTMSFFVVVGIIEMGVASATSPHYLPPPLVSNYVVLVVSFVGGHLKPT